MASDLFSLDGKVAIITGSSRGIGKAIAERMAEAGAKVVISSRKGEACAPVAEAIRAKGGEAIAVPCNIAEDDGLQNLVDETRQKLGPIDILVCNAAANPVYGPMADVDDEAFDKVLHNNVKQNVKLAHLCLPDMAEKGDGAVIIVSSIAGMGGSKNLGVYAISKAADFQIARNLAVEWSPKGVRANCIAPGLIKTDFARALWENPKTLAYVERMTPLGRMGDPDDIAGVAVFLASPAARYISGQTVTVDGGMTIGDAF